MLILPLVTVTTIILALAVAGFLRIIAKTLYANPGNTIDSHHEVRWKYGNGPWSTGGPATERQVYEHYHGSGSWKRRHQVCLTSFRFIAFAATVLVDIVLVIVAASFAIRETACVISLIIIMSIISLLVITRRS